MPVPGEGTMTTSEQLDGALGLAKRVLKPDPGGPVLEPGDIAELARSVMLLDAALARGAPFPATWCRAVPTGTPVHRSLQCAAAQARTHAVGVARRILEPTSAKVSASEVVLMARSVMELHFALMRGGDYPPSWMAPPARLQDVTETATLLVA
jgi:hypothetical protein